ncbi:helix-turn-helix transcriptional regulator [Levilactobacillus brevis]|nr:transcriptional regulator [Levilactobacillus brevis]
MKNTIATRRKQRKLSQAELAQLTAVTRQTINTIENNKYDPSLSLAFKLAAILETTVDALFSNGEDVKSVVLKGFFGLHFG